MVGRITGLVYHLVVQSALFWRTSGQYMATDVMLMLGLMLLLALIFDLAGGHHHLRPQTSRRIYQSQNEIPRWLLALCLLVIEKELARLERKGRATDNKNDADR